MLTAVQSTWVYILAFLFDQQSRDVDHADKGAVREANMYYAIESGIKTEYTFL